MNATFASSVLILEDEPLIAMDLEDAVEKIGFASVTTLTRSEDATVWLESNCPTLAIIDIQLKDGPCVEVAETLDKRAVPFIVCSGAERWEIHKAFRKGIWLPKPCDPVRLIDAVCYSAPEVCAPHIHG